MKNGISINLPFPGFYESDLSHALDHEEKQWAEWETDNHRGRVEGEGEGQYPEAIRLSEDELRGLASEHLDYKKACQHVAKDYVATLAWLAERELKIPVAFEYEEMTSPREYNFETDRVFVQVRLGVLYLMFRQSRTEGHATLGKIIRDRFTSRSGFYSHYSNDLAEWLEKPLREWDHNEAGTLFLAALEIVGVSEERTRDMESLHDSIYEGMSESSDFMNAWDSGMNWTELEKAREALRNEKRAQLAEDDPEYAAALTAFCDDPRQLNLKV